MQPVLKFNVRNQNISRVDNFLPIRHSRNYLYAEFDFLTCDWDGKTKTALFKGDGIEPIPVVLGDTDTCLVPWEVLDCVRFSVTVFGGNLVTVDSASVKLYESGYKSGDIPDPTDTVYEQIMKAFDDAKQYTAEQAELSKRYAVGSLSYPESKTDNAKYYSEQASENASQTERDRKEVEGLVVQLDEVRQNMALTEEYKNQAAESAAKAMLSESNAKASENATSQFAAGAEASENAASQWAEEARQSKEDAEELANQVANDKADISTIKESVEYAKESVDDTVDTFGQTVLNATNDIIFAGQTQKENVVTAGQDQIENIQTAGAGAVAGVNAAKMEAVQSVQNEGTAQVANVQAAAAEIEADREQIQQNTDGITALQEEVRLDAPGIIESAKGETILATDSSNKAFAGMRQYGRTTQETTTGQQLYDVDAIGGIYPMQADEDGYYTLDFDNSEGTNTGFLNLTVKPSELTEPNTEYLIVAEVKEISGCTLRPSSAANVGVVNFIGQIETNLQTNSSGTYVLNANSIADLSEADCMLRTYIQVSPGASGHCVFRLSVIKDLTITADNFVYEPYTGGVPSPNPEYPQEVVSAGNDGEIITEVMGANLLDYDRWKKADIINGTGEYKDYGIVITAGENGSAYTEYNASSVNALVIPVIKGVTYTLSWDWSGSSSGRVAILKNGKASYGFVIAKAINGSLSYTVEEDVEIITFRAEVTEPNATATYKNIMLNIGNKPLSWEPYKPKQTLIHTTSDGLPGIPVSSGGNYIDESGQQWIADYRDWGRGVDVQMVGVVDNAKWFKSNIAIGQNGCRLKVKLNDAVSIKNVKVMCSHFGQLYVLSYSTEGEYISTDEMHDKLVSIRLSEDMGVEDFKVWATENNMVTIYPLADPIETPIPADELTAYRAAHTNKTYTTIINDDGVYTEVEYVADTETYINNNYVPKDIYTALEERVAALEANAIS